MDNNLNTRQLQAIETKNRIIETFFTLLKSKTLDEVKITDLCKAADISVGAFYHHYGSKEEVLGETFNKFDDYVQNVLMKQTYESSTDAIVDFLYHEIIGAVDQGINITREVLKLTLKSDAHPYFTDKTRTSHMYLTTLINKAKDDNTLPDSVDTDQLFDLLLRHARGIGYDWVAHNGNYNLGQTLRYDLSIILNSFKV